MRYQHARFVLAACLFAAAAAAQTPGTFDGFQVLDAAALRTQPPRDAVATTFAAATASRLRAAFQDPDYSQRGLFLQQHGDFMNRMERYEPMVAFDATYLPNQRVNHEPGSFDMLGYGVDANLPFNVSTDGYLLFGAYYNARQYKFSNATTLNDETVIGAGVKLGFGGFLDDNTLLEVETHPGVYSDADAGLHHEDFDFPSHLLVTYRAVDPFFLKIGVRYNQVYEEAPWLPLLGFSWDITGTSAAASGDAYTGSWRLDLMFPEHLEVSYWPSPSTGWMWGVEVTGAEYHVRTSMATGNQRTDISVQEVVTYLGLTHRMSDAFSMAVRVGAVIAGDYDLSNGALAQNRIEGALDQGFFASLTLGLDF